MIINTEIEDIVSLNEIKTASTEWIAKIIGDCNEAIKNNKGSELKRALYYTSKTVAAILSKAKNSFVDGFINYDKDGKYIVSVSFTVMNRAETVFIVFAPYTGD